MSGATKVSFRANFGQPPQIVFTGGGVSLSAQCDANASAANPNLRAIATAENSSLEIQQSVETTADLTGIQPMNTANTNEAYSDIDFDSGENDSVALHDDDADLLANDESIVGVLVNSGPSNAVVVAVYHASVTGGQPQGDCTYDGLVWTA